MRSPGRFTIDGGERALMGNDELVVRGWLLGRRVRRTGSTVIDDGERRCRLAVRAIGPGDSRRSAHDRSQEHECEQPSHGNVNVACGGSLATQLIAVNDVP
jgi:hypothetical protein